MTPERSHHITLYVLMGIVVAHETASFTVRHSICFFEDLKLLLTRYVGRSLSMHANFILLVSWESSSEPALSQHLGVRHLQQRLESSRRFRHLVSAHPGSLEPQSACGTKDRTLLAHRHQLHRRHLLHCPHGSISCLDAVRRYFMELSIASVLR